MQEIRLIAAQAPLSSPARTHPPSRAPFRIAAVEQVILGNAIANGVFMVAVNRIGKEPPLRFYGSSFICDPYGRKLVQAPRDEPAVLVADLDLDQRHDWLELFPLLGTRRPDTYGPLAEQPAGEDR
jgi:N-carbamoylputrescine amidase